MKETYLRWKVPCLGLRIVGEQDTLVFQGYSRLFDDRICLDCDITFYALLAVDHRIMLVSLTPTLSCIQSASDSRDRKSLYLALTAASVLQAHILEDAQKLLIDPTAAEMSAEIPTPARRYPAISKLSKYPTSPGPDDYLTFEICDLFDPFHDRLLYKARRSDVDELILIKYVRQYSTVLHRFARKQVMHHRSLVTNDFLVGGLLWRWNMSSLPP